MAKKSETTTKFKLDITELKAGIREANRQIGLANSEFKKASAGMEEWAKDADGLSAKLKQLKEVTGQYEKILSMVQQQYKKVVEEQGENSKGATDLKIRMNNLEATIKSNYAAMRKYETALNGIGEESQKAETESKGLKEEMQGAGKAAKDSAEGFTVAKGAISELAAAGIKKAAEELKEFAKEISGTNAKFQAQTGLSKKAAAEFNEEMEEIYKKGYGESLGEIAEGMAMVKQQTNETDPKKIKELTENTLALTEVFGGDFNENLRGANALIVNLGTDGEKAFDYIAKAAQNGLNKSGELTDNLAEYAQIFGQAGFSAEEMFSILDNGLDAGAYNLDKVNDFVKEFTISLADGRIEENIKSFSGETKTLFEEWKKGKASAKDVFYSVINDLDHAKNKQEALTTASTVWSALGEDNAMDVIRALNDVNDTYKDVEGTMQKIKDVQYEDVSREFKKLGRTIKTDVIAPIAKEALPAAKEFVNYTSENLEDIIPIAKGVGVAMGGIFVTNKVSAFGKAIAGMVSPMGLLTTAAGVLAGAMVAVKDGQEKNIDAAYGMTEEQKKLSDAIGETTEHYTEMKKTMQESVSGISEEYGYLQKLKEELQGIVDANGKVKEGYEERANFIVNELAQKLGIEIDLTGGVIKNYKNLQDEIQKTIEAKKAEATLNAVQSSYEEAIKKRTEAYEEYNAAVEKASESKRKLNRAESDMEEMEERLQKLYESGAVTMKEKISLEDQNRKEVEKARETYEKMNKKMEEAQEAYLGYNTTIKNYEGLSSAIISGDSKKIETAMIKVKNSFIDAENGTKESLERQAENARTMYEDMKKALEEGAPGVTETMVNEARIMAEMAAAELGKLPPKAGTTGMQAGQQMAAGISGQKIGVEQAARDVSNTAKTGLGSANTYNSGVQIGSNYKMGLQSQKSTIEIAAKDAGNAAKKKLEVDTKSSGRNFVLGFKNGMNDNSAVQQMLDTAAGIGSKAYFALRKSIAEASPSKKTRKSGKNFVMGFTLEVANGYKTVAKTVKKMGETAIKELENIKMPSVKGVEVARNKMISGRKETARMARQNVTINNNYYNTRTFNQTNSSPKALSRKEIYLQTDSLLRRSRGV